MAAEQHKHTTTQGSSKPGNTDFIRSMLREQKKQCSSLHSNTLFQEFWSRTRAPQDAPPPVIDDLEAGQCLLLHGCSAWHLQQGWLGPVASRMAGPLLHTIWCMHELLSFSRTGECC